MHAWKFFIATFGCKVNQYESQSLREAWQKLGGEECDVPGEADVLCVNSCAITAKGERDARNAVFRLRREAPAARLILTGCAARLFTKFRPLPGAAWAEPDLLVPQEDKSRLLRGPWPEGNAPGLPAAESIRAEAPANFPPFRISSFRRARPVLKVQDGCAHRCTYCIVPLTRSRRRASSRTSFWDLLRFLDGHLAPEFAGRARLRISSLEPSQLDRRGLETLTACRMLCPHLHISLQHASPAVLKRMGRGHYTAGMLEEGVAALAAHWPRMGLGADILVGFPGETDEDLRLLLELVQRLPLSYAHVFPYSRRPGTAAEAFAGHLPQALKLRRAAEVRAAVARRHQDFLRDQLALPRMLVAADILKHAPAGADAGMPETDGPSGLCKGVNEFYAPCFFRAPANGTVSPEVLSGLLAARPVRATEKGLLVELMSDFSH